MSNRMFQNIVNQLYETVNKTIGIIDETAVIIACSNADRIGEVVDGITNEFFVAMQPLVVEGKTFYPIGGNGTRAEYAVFVDGYDVESLQYAKVLSISFKNVKLYFDEKYDKGNFIKNVIMDNILPGDIYLKSRELRFKSEATRVCLLVKITSRTDISVYDVIQNLFPDKAKDFVINISETDIAVVKEVKPNVASTDLEKLAGSIVDTLSSEFYTHCIVGIGTVVSGVKDLARSFKEAQMSLEVSKVFDTEKTVANYDNLGIARLIYQLPTTLCDMFLREVFKRGTIESLDQENLFTIQRFFENNLNVSETSRKLFIHRNTLVYRLEKIKKITGLDLREFEDAIVFKVALMVRKYLTSSPMKY
ncbi:MAG: helix-turn-helix domain-containing protein [Clostridia bacterium]|nr:helix-turn-helix domain-containing protein [Clostridia bacterium]